jgi:hypothetical protein
MLTEARQIRARQVLSKQDLLMLLNFELSAYEDCADCHFTSVKTTAARDESGSNWRGAKVQVEGEMTETAREIAGQVLHEVRETYNVE